LPDARHILSLADDAKRRLQRASARSTPVRLGYVSWLPEDITALVGSAADLRVDEWVLPSHAQADRVAEGTLDVALAWVTADQVSDRGLIAHLMRTEPLRAVLPGAGSTEPVAAQRLSVLVDADESAWSSWNRYATEFAAAVDARVVHIDDGGITGDAFHAHVRKVGGAVLASPKRHTAALPPSLGQRPVADPTPLWTWSLLHRRDDDRASVRDAVDALLTIARTRDWPAPPAGRWWVPAGDPHLR
ncbi:LysR family transcriptional regulator, partial [Mycobacterium scrofulaceum]